MGDYFYSEINMKCARRIHFTLLRYTSSWYGKFYIELTKNITYGSYFRYFKPTSRKLKLLIMQTIFLVP